MSLSAREQKDLDSLAVRLAAADPGLASLLGMFGQLAVGEGMPLRERTRPYRPQTARGRHRKPARRGSLRAASQHRHENRLRLALLVSFIAFFGLVLGVLVSTSGHADCAYPGIAPCATRAPARAPLDLEK